ncbi:PLC-like phosphodiesterase [Massarina eburnea CBS 473.64]|uniref:PLC-like phosphodiesterase n=1 Tax=Massarina eburnea CBS 473.64 TaxID=1395130 RepID=A0A6A6S8S1_9PLEO|nr:PLC-like phosphodiesterase [Massarina eburnea CBS 473.64]
MIPLKAAFLFLILPHSILTQSSSDSSDSSSSSFASRTSIAAPSEFASTISTASVSLASTSSSTSSDAFLGITGASNPSSSQSTATASTSSSPQTTNTQKCNGNADFCGRRYSNVSMVVAHNSPFAVAHNAASNQVYTVIPQLEDGIRGLQFETHYPNASAGLHLCHTSCSLLDVGTLEAYLTTVTGWLADNPYEVITIMMGNDNRVPPSTYVSPFQDSGILSYVYTPSASNLTLDEWPTLGEMILLNKRVVVMLDYLANQTEVPWLLDQFAYQWQTPFSPTDPAFPCTVQRPENQAEAVSRNMTYMANHNLNVDITLAGLDLLIPAYTLLGEVNAVSGNGSLGLAVNNCTAMWGRPPNFLLVDYYNFGNFNGSVFQVAATANNVSYQQGSCCGGTGTTGAAIRTECSRVVYVSLVVVSVLVLVLV